MGVIFVSRLRYVLILLERATTHWRAVEHPKVVVVGGRNGRPWVLFGVFFFLPLFQWKVKKIKKL